MNPNILTWIFSQLAFNLMLLSKGALSFTFTDLPTGPCDTPGIITLSNGLTAVFYHNFNVSIPQYQYWYYLVDKQGNIYGDKLLLGIDTFGFFSAARQSDGSVIASFTIDYSISGIGDGSGYGCFVSKFTSDMTSLTTYQVNTNFNGNQHVPEMSMWADGKFVVAFMSYVSS